ARDRRRRSEASRMYFGFRIMCVDVCASEELRVNNEKQSINRRPRQLISSWLVHCNPYRTHNVRNKSALMLGLRRCSQSRSFAFLSSFLIGHGSRSRGELAYSPKLE